MRGTLLERALGCLGVLNSGTTVGTVGTGMGKGIGNGGGEGGGGAPGLLTTTITLGSFFFAVLFFIWGLPEPGGEGGGPPPEYCITSIGSLGGII